MEKFDEYLSTVLQLVPLPPTPTDILPWSSLQTIQLVEDFLTWSEADQRKLCQAYSAPFTFSIRCKMIADILHQKNYRILMPYGLELSRMYAILPSGHRVHFIARITPDEDQHVYLGQVGDKKLVIKWETNIDEEIAICARLHQAGGTIPAFFPGAVFWGAPVLVMEKFEPLDSTDDPIAVGRAMLKILQSLHSWAVHNDIKPSNIMKRIGNDFGPFASPEYILIDFGGASVKKKYYGYERSVWSHAWTSQPIEPGQITTPKNDLLELGFTIRGLQLQLQFPGIRFNSNEERQREILPDNPILYSYMEQIRQLDERKLYLDQYTCWLS